eukprot:6461779-Prymnesium_polylepis.1
MRLDYFPGGEMPPAVPLEGTWTTAASVLEARSECAGSRSPRSSCVHFIDLDCYARPQRGRRSKASSASSAGTMEFPRGDAKPEITTRQ